VVCDNYATHKHAKVRKWLARPENQRITLHFVPTLLVAEPRGMLLLRHHPAGHPPRQLRLRQRAHLGHRRLHRPLERAPRPFTWSKNADEILASIQRAKTKTNSFTPLGPQGKALVVQTSQAGLLHRPPHPWPARPASIPATDCPVIMQSAGGLSTSGCHSDVAVLLGPEANGYKPAVSP
jgi:hypothetical protein